MRHTIDLSLLLLLMFTAAVHASDSRNQTAEVFVDSITLLKKNWNDPFNPDAELKVLMIAIHDNREPSTFSYPSTGFVKASEGSVVEYPGGDGIAITIPNTRDPVYVLMFALDEDGFFASPDIRIFAGYAAKKLFKHPMLKVAPSVVSIWDWLAREAEDEGLPKVKDFIKKHNIIGTSAIAFRPCNSCDASTGKHSGIATNGSFIYEYELRGTRSRAGRYVALPLKVHRPDGDIVMNLEAQSIAGSEGCTPADWAKFQILGEAQPGFLYDYFRIAVEPVSPLRIGDEEYVIEKAKFFANIHITNDGLPLAERMLVMQYIQEIDLVEASWYLCGSGGYLHFDGFRIPTK